MHGSSWALIHWKVLKLSVFTNYYVDLKVTWESDLVIYIFFGYESDMMDMFFSFFFLCRGLLGDTREMLV